MDFINDIVDTVRKTPIVQSNRTWRPDDIADAAFKKMTENQEYRILMDSMIGLYSDALAKGVPATRAAAVVLSTHESIMREILADAVRARLEKLGADDLRNLNNSYLEDSFKKKLEVSKEELDKVECRFRLYSENEKTAQFKFSLMYAAERWGTPEERTAIDSLVTRIKDEPIKKK